jgi:O-antigen/teichoic acid export membrane protein
VTLGRNLLAGLANSIWSALIGLAVVPFYLKYLGIEAYGLIGFFITTQALLQLLDMGMAPTINREVARCSASGNLKEAGKLLHTLAVVYWSMAAAIAALVLALAPLIAEFWLQSKQLSQQTITYAVMLMGMVVACRWPIGLYQGALIGAQRLTVSSGINMVMLTVGSLGAVAILAFLSPTIEAFFIWQAFVGLLYAGVIRLAAWRIIGKTEKNSFDFVKLKSVWRFTAGMSAISLFGMIFTQLDKLLLSKLLSLEEFAHYMLAAVVVGGLSIVIAPMYNTVYPRFSAMALEGESEELGKQYKFYTRVLSIFLFPLAMILVVYSNELIEVWTGNRNIGVSVGPIVSFLAIGSALNGVMTIPHALQLAFGMTRLPLITNSSLVVIVVPLIVYLSLRYGALGGAIAWLLLNVFYLLFSTWLMHKYLLKGWGCRWLVYDVGVPISMVVVVGVLSKYICLVTDLSVHARLLIGGVEVVFMIVAGLLFTPQLAQLIIKSFQSKRQ